MDAVLAHSFVPQVVVAASDDCKGIYESALFAGDGVHAVPDSDLRVRLCALPSLARPREVDAARVDVEAETRAARRRSGAAYFGELLETLVLATFGAGAVQPFETFGHPVACILVVSSRNPSPISALTQLYQQSYQDCPDFVSADFLRCVWFVNDGAAAPSPEDFAAVNSQFAPFCYEVSENEYGAGVAVTAADAVFPYMRRVLKEWQDSHAAKSNTTFGIGKFLKKLVTNGPPRPETNLFFTVCRTLQPHVASIPAPGKAHAVDLDMQMRRLADLAFMLRDYKLAYAAYDSLRKPFLGDKQWAHFGAVHEMLALTAALVHHGDVNALIDTALYTYNSRCHLPLYALRCTLLVCGALVESGGELVAAGWLGTLLLDIDPVFGSGDEPAETAMLMERTARAFETRGWHRKTSLWLLLADKEWQRSGIPSAEAPPIASTPRAEDARRTDGSDSSQEDSRPPALPAPSEMHMADVALEVSKIASAEPAPTAAHAAPEAPTATATEAPAGDAETEI